MSSPGSLRLFLGIPLSEKEKQLLAKRVSHIGSWPIDMRVTDVKTWHVTLYFFGAISKEQLGNLLALLNLVLKEKKGFNLTFNDWFLAPKPATARMLWARFQQSDAFLDVYQAIDARLPAYFEIPQRRLKPIPHITLARWKASQTRHRLPLPMHRGPDIKVKKLVLWKSELHPQGPKYTPIQEFLLQT